MNITREEFDDYVQQAIESIDPAFGPYLDEVPVIVEDNPDDVVCRDTKLDDPHCLLGVFRGLPLNKRSVHSAGYTNQIILYRRNILDRCRSRRQLLGRIRKTIIHELGHYLGFSEQQLRQHHH